jgi:hypothetical protein
MASAPEDKPTEVINLLGWHRGLHMITGAMALRFNRAALSIFFSKKNLTVFVTQNSGWLASLVPVAPRP